VEGEFSPLYDRQLIQHQHRQPAQKSAPPRFPLPFHGLIVRCADFRQGASPPEYRRDEYIALDQNRLRSEPPAIEREGEECLAFVEF
jgi:hypothetical protein